MTSHWGYSQTVASDVEKIISAGTAIGLSLNISKCELIAHKDLLVDDSVLHSFKKVDIEDTTLLGAALFPGLALDEVWEDRCEDLARAADRLSDINSQDALILLRSSFSASKELHLSAAVLSVSFPFSARLLSPTAELHLGPDIIAARDHVRLLGVTLSSDLSVTSTSIQ